MTLFGKHLAKVLLRVSMAGVMGFVPDARGQSQPNSSMAAKPDTPNPADQGWHVDVAPYLWFPGISGTVGAAGYETGVHVTGSDVLSYVNFGLMGAADIRYNRILMPVDFMWVKLTDDKGLPIGQAVGVTSIHMKLNEDIFTPKIGYQLVSKERFKIDAVMGIRYWHLGTTLKLQPTQIANGFYRSSNWVDGVEGARFTAMLTPKLGLTIAGDAGAGGASLDYQVVGLLGYRVKRATLQGGWRYLVIHKSPSSRSFAELSMSGIVVGAVIPLK